MFLRNSRFMEDITDYLNNNKFNESVTDFAESMFLYGAAMKKAS